MEYNNHINISMDEILVVDIEATCWKDSPPVGQVSEIIEIGLCLLDAKKLVKIDSRSILVKPKNSTISEFCTELTGLTQADVDTGISFRAACRILETEYDSNRLMWASYGYYDKHKFMSQCDTGHIPYPFSKVHINVKEEIAELLGVKPVGMDKMLTKLGMSLDGVHHRGEDDACNIAKILAYILAKGRE